MKGLCQTTEFLHSLSKRHQNIPACACSPHGKVCEQKLECTPCCQLVSACPLTRLTATETTDDAAGICNDARTSLSLRFCFPFVFVDLLNKPCIKVEDFSNHLLIFKMEKKVARKGKKMFECLKKKNSVQRSTLTNPLWKMMTQGL